MRVLLVGRGVFRERKTERPRGVGLLYLFVLAVISLMLFSLLRRTPVLNFQRAIAFFESVQIINS